MDQNSKKKLDDDQHTSRGDLETSPKASIDRHQPNGIDRQPPHIINQRTSYIIDPQSEDSIDLHPHSIIDRDLPDCIDRHPLLEEPHGYIVDLGQVEERVHESEASHLTVHGHLRPPICAEEVVGFHKRVKRIHAAVKIVVPCAVFKVEFSIPPDKGVHLSSYIEVLDDHQHVEASQRGLRFRDKVDKGPAEATSIDTDRIPSNDTNKPASIDTITSTSIDSGRVSEQKEFDVCGNFFDGKTTTRSDKSGGNKRRNWKKRKMTKGGSHSSLIPHFSNGVRKSRETKLTSNTKLDTTACLGAWYTLDQILQTSLEGMCPHIICVSPSSSAANVGKEDSCGGYGGSGSMKSLGKSFSRYLYSLSCFSSSQVTIGSSSYPRASSSSLRHILASPRS
ncbi:hypothetical protein F2Q70_00039162 [Brassica cretica]|uniref:Uncharacterized protein n=1 Tax=Brassica cretica TaxID=69181 RepID=A0A8S9KBA0_BRACR|nr:hypothetical protein F2Q70_00039162 [Brassica cretica]